MMMFERIGQRHLALQQAAHQLAAVLHADIAQIA